MYYNFSEGFNFLREELIMNKIIPNLFFVSLSVSALVGCTNTDVGTSVGAAAGAGVGYAVSGGSALGTVVGAGAGALVGNSIGQDQDRRDYYRSNYYYY
jgi:hypothetical protein